MLEEGSVVGAGAKRSDMCFALRGWLAVPGGTRFGLLIGLPLFVNCASLRTGNFFGHFTDELHEGRNGGGGEVRTWTHLRRC